jgi:hypothetical protein
MVMTYGIERSSPPSKEECNSAREKVIALHRIDEKENILLFNGAFDYKPNLEGLKILLHVINPLLASDPTFKYRLLICGRKIPDEIFNAIFPNVILAGFVDDIDLYFLSADIFLNPIIEGGGIKTKLVEALGSNCNAVSTANGATGVPEELCNGKLTIVADGDWHSFAQKVTISVSEQNDIPEKYFQHFYWGDSTLRAARFIEMK